MPTTKNIHHESLQKVGLLCIIGTTQMILYKNDKVSRPKYDTNY